MIIVAFSLSIKPTLPIEWDKVVTHLDDNALKSTGARKIVTGKKRKVKYFVTHWDVCLSSESCVRVLNKRNLSGKVVIILYYIFNKYKNLYLLFFTFLIIVFLTLSINI